MKFALLVVISVYFLPLLAETYEYRLTCVGIPIASISVHDKTNNNSDKSISVYIKSLNVTSLFPYISNHYVTYYKDNYVPYRYEKLVNQAKYREDRSVDFDQSKGLAIFTDNLSRNNFKYDFPTPTRDFFSALLYIKNRVNQVSYLWIDANKKTWRLHSELIGREKISTPLGKQWATKVRFTFKKNFQGETENTDMVTNNLIREDRELILWFGEQKPYLPLMAKASHKLVPVYLTLQKYLP